MTTSSDWLSNHWSLFQSGYDPETSEVLYQLLQRHGITPSEHFVYGAFRRFMDAQGCNSTEPFCFHSGRYVGTYDSVEQYLAGKGLNETNTRW